MNGVWRPSAPRHIIAAIGGDVTVLSAHPSRETKGKEVVSDLRAAWGRIVKHLRAEANWRESRDVDVLSWYQYSESLGQEFAPGCFFKLEANLSYCVNTLDEAGAPIRSEFGDVFGHLDSMVRLGEHAIGQLEREVAQQAPGGERSRGAAPLLAEAAEDGSWISLQVNDLMPHESWRFGHLDGAPQVLAERSSCSSQDVCYRALEQTMDRSCLRWRDPTEPGGTHDVDMCFPGSTAPPVRVEFTELTSEMGEQWGKWPRSGRPRSAAAADDQLKYLWHASMNMTDTLFHPAWGSLVRDGKARRQRSAEIDGILLEFLSWVEGQLSTIEGAVSLANQVISSRLKPGGRLLVFPHFNAEKPPGGAPGGLTVAYDGYSVDSSTIGTSKAVEPLNQVIAHKAEKNQAGALPGEKWLVVYLDPVYAIAVALTLEALLRRPEAWLAFESEINRRHFDEVWLVWDKRPTQENVPDPEDAINIARITS